MMCLGTVYYGEKKKAELTKLPDMVRCWKVVGRYGNTYYPPIYNRNDYEKGWNEVKPISKCSGYWIAYHAFLRKKDAKNWSTRNQIVVQSRTKKEDIVAIGKQEFQTYLVIVTKRIWIPKPRHKERQCQR